MYDLQTNRALRPFVIMSRDISSLHISQYSHDDEMDKRQVCELKEDK